MIIGRVSGTITSTVNHPFYDSRKLLVVEETTPVGAATGGYVIAIDVVQAGLGDLVLVLGEGNGARQVLDAPDAPVRSVVVGVVDAVEATGNPPPGPT